MAKGTNSQERVSFQRRREFPGIEVRSVEDSGDFRHYTPDYEFLCVGTWRGEIGRRHRSVLLDETGLVCSQPGEVVWGRSLTGGSRISLCIERDVLAAQLSEHGIDLANVRLKPFTRMSPRLRECLQRVLAAMDPSAARAELQTSLSEFVGVIASELIEGASNPSVRFASGRRDAERVREYLQNDPSVNVDLASVAKQMGVSRFRALRVFKRWYGLPPHAYQLRVRLGLVQKSLRDGLKPAEAAAEFGFFDQSHLTRHFRRLFGVTPAAYARIGG
ncbi:MAG: helix-turn-helix transcriptional regulator [Myxococcota bacterium]